MNDIGIIRLSRDQGFAVVDAVDFPQAAAFRWHLENGYARRSAWESGQSKKRYLHQLINQTPPGMLTDHANGNRLDNRRCNLRSVTPRQSAMNYGKHPGTTSVYKGVSWHKAQGRWFCTIWANGRSHSLGYFAEERDAAQAYNAAAANFFGEYARLNQL